MISKHLSCSNLKQMKSSFSGLLIYNQFCQIKKVQNIWSMQFNADDWTIFLYVFYPQLQKKRQKPIYEIYNKKAVMALSFVNKTLQSQKAWLQRKSFALTLPDTIQLSQISPTSKNELHLSSTQQSQYSQKTKHLHLLPNPQTQQILFKYSETMQQPQKQRKSKQQKKQNILFIEAKMCYQQYRIMNKIIEKCLLELGGWKMMFDIHQTKNLEAIRDLQKKQEEVQQIFKNQKME